MPKAAHSSGGMNSCSMKSLETFTYCFSDANHEPTDAMISPATDIMPSTEVMSEAIKSQTLSTATGVVSRTLVVMRMAATEDNISLICPQIFKRRLSTVLRAEATVGRMT